MDDAAALVRGCGRAARAGATMIQVRERSLDDRTLFDLTVAIVRETAAAGARVVVNDRLDVATGSRCGRRSPPGARHPAGPGAGGRLQRGF